MLERDYFNQSVLLLTKNSLKTVKIVGFNALKHPIWLLFVYFQFIK